MPRQLGRGCGRRGAAATAACAAATDCLRSRRGRRDRAAWWPTRRRRPEQPCGNELGGRNRGVRKIEGPQALTRSGLLNHRHKRQGNKAGHGGHCNQRCAWPSTASGAMPGPLDHGVMDAAEPGLRPIGLPSTNRSRKRDSELRPDVGVLAPIARVRMNAQNLAYDVAQLTGSKQRLERSAGRRTSSVRHPRRRERVHAGLVKFPIGTNVLVP